MTYQEALAKQLGLKPPQHLKSDLSGRMVFGAPVATDTFFTFVGSPPAWWQSGYRRMDGTIEGDIYSSRMVLVPHSKLKTPTPCNEP